VHCSSSDVQVGWYGYDCTGVLAAGMVDDVLSGKNV
jgi:hypothetical protein